VKRAAVLAAYDARLSFPLPAAVRLAGFTFAIGRPHAQQRIQLPLVCRILLRLLLHTQLHLGGLRGSGRARIVRLALVGDAKSAAGIAGVVSFAGERLDGFEALLGFADMLHDLADFADGLGRRCGAVIEKEACDALHHAADNRMAQDAVRENAEQFTAALLVVLRIPGALAPEI